MSNEVPDYPPPPTTAEALGELRRGLEALRDAAKKDLGDDSKDGEGK